MREYFRTLAGRRRGGEDGASAVEYGLLVAAIAAIIVAVVFAIGQFVRSGFDETCDELAANPGAQPPPAGAVCP